MQHFWLNKDEQNKNFILFLNGWAMNESPIKHLKSNNYDILVVFDYRNIDFNFFNQFDFTKYNKKYLVSWSMGVYVANLFYSELNLFDKKIAINGTAKIIDDNFGIPEKVYKITTKFLNEDSKDKFIKNMFKNGELNPNITITRELTELKEELVSIQKIKTEKELKFNKAIISNDDRIIPTKNQIAFWKDKTQIVQIDSTHCPFEIYKSWQEIVC